MALLSLSACGKKQGEVVTQAPLEAKLGAYDTLFITAVAQQDADAVHTARLAHAIKADVEGRGTFATVLVGEDEPTNGLALQVTLVELDSGQGVARALNMGGEAEMKVSCALVELGTDKPIGTFDATGNSSRKVHTSINGVDTGIADDLTGRAISATAAQVGEFLASNR